MAEFSYYYLACEDFMVAGQEDQHTLEDLESIYPDLDQESACNYALYALPAQSWLNLESDFNSIAGYIERLRVWGRAGYQQSIDQHRIITKATEDIKAQLEAKKN